MSANIDSGTPVDWPLVRLGEVADVQLGKMLSPKAKRGRGALPYLRNLNVRWHGFNLNDLLEMNFDPREVEKYRLETGDVLVCEGGEPGRAAVWREQFPGMLYQKALHRIRVCQDVLNPYFLAYRLEFDAATGLLAKHFTGSTIKHFPRASLLQYEFPIPPRGTQDRIVSVLEEHLTRVDAAVAALVRVRANLKRYRASVLKAACEGRLVPTEVDLARREGRDYEPADVLLQRVLKERRAHWEAEELTKLRRSGKAPMDERWKGRYQSPAAPDTSNRPSLPEGWTWATWEQLSMRVTVGHVGPMKHRYADHGVPFLRSQNVRENRFDPEGLLHISQEFHEELRKSVVRPGDVVVVRSGAVGVTCVVPEHLGEANCADLVVIQRPLGIVPWYGAFYMNSLAKRAIREGQVGVALIHFNTKSVAALRIALPPLAEQQRIVAEVDRRLSTIEELELALKRDLRRADHARQAILKRAFEGRLVPQDPNDEPASVLLERIRVERTRKSGMKRGRERRLTQPLLPGL